MGLVAVALHTAGPPLVLPAPFALGALLGALAGGRAGIWAAAVVVAVLIVLAILERTVTLPDRQLRLVVPFVAFLSLPAQMFVAGLAAGASATRSLRRQAALPGSERDARR